MSLIALLPRALSDKRAKRVMKGMQLIVVMGDNYSAVERCNCCDR